MNPARKLLRTRQPLLMAMLSLALLLKAMLPAGIMLDTQPGTGLLTTTLCSGLGDGETITVDLGLPAQPSEPTPHTDMSFCAFGAATAAASILAKPPVVSASLWTRPLANALPNAAFPAGIEPALRPPATGPPSTF